MCIHLIAEWSRHDVDGDVTDPVSMFEQTPATLDVDSPEARARRRALLRSVLHPLIATSLVFFVVLGFLYVPIPPNPDGELLGYMGHVVLKGGVLYRDAGDVNMPGEPLLHGAALAMFGNHYWSYPLLDYLLLLAFVIVMGWLMRADHGILPGLLFLFIYPLVYATAGFWMSGQRDYLAAHAVTVAAFLLLHRIAGRGLVWPILSGALIGVAILLKPTFVVIYPLLLAYDFYRGRRLRVLMADASALALGTAAVIGPLVVLGAVTGALRPWYEVTILYSWENYAADGHLAAVTDGLLRFARISWHWYIVVALCGTVAWTLSRPRHSLAVTLIVGVVVAGSALLQKKGYGYHLAGELVVLTLLGVYFLMEVLRYGFLVPDRRARVLLLMMPLTLFGFGLASKCVTVLRRPALRMAGIITEQQFLSDYAFDDVIATARYVAHATKPGQTVWPYTRHLMICILADRTMPTRFSTPMLLRWAKPSPLAAAWKEEVRLTLEQRPPELIIIERDTDTSPADSGIRDVADHEPLTPLLMALRRRYSHEADIGRFVLFRLAPGGAVGEGPGDGHSPKNAR
jgi:hypothetical protein